MRPTIFITKDCSLPFCRSATFSDRPLLQNGQFCWSSTLAYRPLLQTGRFCTSSTFNPFKRQVTKMAVNFDGVSTFGVFMLTQARPLSRLDPIVGQCSFWIRIVHFFRGWLLLWKVNFQLWPSTFDLAHSMTNCNLAYFEVFRGSIIWNYRCIYFFGYLITW